MTKDSAWEYYSAPASTLWPFMDNKYILKKMRSFKNYLFHIIMLWEVFLGSLVGFIWF